MNSTSTNKYFQFSQLATNSLGVISGTGLPLMVCLPGFFARWQVQHFHAFIIYDFDAFGKLTSLLEIAR
jgi:hypothetical protein